MDWRPFRSIRRRLEHLEAATRVQRDDSVTVARLEAIESDQAVIHGRCRETEETNDQMVTVIGELEQAHKELVLAVAEGIEKTNRAERRIRATVSRARKELAELGLEDPRVEAEAGEIRELDGGGVTPVTVPPMLEEVGAIAETPSSIKGVSQELIRRTRGI